MIKANKSEMHIEGDRVEIASEFCCILHYIIKKFGREEVIHFVKLVLEETAHADGE